MLKTKFCFIFLIILSSSYGQKTHDYLLAPNDSIDNVYFSNTIQDPYQWMENGDDARLTEWLESQDKLARKIKKRNFTTNSLKGKISAMYYGVRENIIDGYVKKDAESISKYQFKYKSRNSDRSPDLLYRLRDKGNYQRLIEVKDYMNDKDDHLDIVNYNVNEDYDLVAVELSHNGSDWRELLFFNLKTGEQILNSIKNIRTSSKFIWDEMNLFYDAYDAPLTGRELLDKPTGQKLFYHRFGKKQIEDEVLYINPDSSGTTLFRYFKLKDKLFFYDFYNHNGKIYNTISVSDSTYSNLSLKKFIIYPDDEGIEISVEELFDDTVVLKTNWNAPNGRVLLSDLNNPNNPKEIVPEYDVILKEVNRLGKDKIACIYKNGNKDLALIYDLEGNLLKKIDFPEGKKLHNFYEKNEDVEHTDFYVSSFYHPNLWYQLSLKDLTFKPSQSISVPYDPKSLETRYVQYPSKDGTLIPMYITCLKATKLNGKNPTLLYGYGGYGITVEPAFDESQALWLLHGGVLAVPNVRGGGAGGSQWGMAGRRLNKQNCIDDFNAAADYLIDQNYTSSEKLGANGGSHGGLLVAAAAIQRPELFKAIIAEAGPYDMLRFENFTIGSINISTKEFGTTSDSSDFKNLRSYSPLHNIKEGVKYPNILLMTGDSDDRVPPHHTYKFLATLQAKGSPESLYIMYLIPGAGHGGALTFNDWFDKVLYKYAFLYDQLF